MSSKVEDAALIMVNVLLRKSISVYKEFACMLVDVLSLLVSAVQFSGIIARRSSTSSGRFSSPAMMSMAVRHYR
ncbi:hypothetical protein CDL15_Pgr007690 [Punica granatum]|uniref:Uncharacterized protein n=1 Tax=Punica granatum TaxID=22663 RepID=A0A218XBC2_PUNGR|nr:hypothetical protein CDL15_Pgr007690 [Punica granatum]PKI35927.1 hypothetical protein CRG98_043681 [Punica granatum]